MASTTRRPGFSPAPPASVMTDPKAFVCTGPAPRGTSRPGVFTVGIGRTASVKRVASSVGEGSVVISEVWRDLNPAV